MFPLAIPALTFGQKAIAYALVVLLIFVSGGWAGGKLVNNHWKAKEAARVQAEQAEVARLSKIAGELGQALATETRKRQEDARAHRAEINQWRQNATVQVECPTGGIARITPDDIRFDAGFVDIWNAGLRLGLPPAAAPGRPDATPKRTDPPTASELLTNSADNAEACNGDRARMKALQKYVREFSGSK